MSTAADELRAASTRLRELARAVDADIAANPYWASEKHPPHDYPNLYARGVDNGLGGPAGAYAAAMGPPVGTALADWLDEEADSRDASLVAAIQIWGNAEHPDAVAWLTTGLGKGSAPALDLARQINTGSRP